MMIQISFTISDATMLILLRESRERKTTKGEVIALALDALVEKNDGQQRLDALVGGLTGAATPARAMAKLRPEERG